MRVSANLPDLIVNFHHELSTVPRLLAAPGGSPRMILPRVVNKNTGFVSPCPIAFLIKVYISVKNTKTKTKITYLIITLLKDEYLHLRFHTCPVFLLYWLTLYSLT